MVKFWTLGKNLNCTVGCCQGEVQQELLPNYFRHKGHGKATPQRSYWIPLKQDSKGKEGIRILLYFARSPSVPPRRNWVSARWCIFASFIGRVPVEGAPHLHATPFYAEIRQDRSLRWSLLRSLPFWPSPGHSGESDSAFTLTLLNSSTRPRWRRDWTGLVT